MNSIIQNFISRFLAIPKDHLFINADFSHGQEKKTLFGLDNISKAQPLFFHDYFQNKDTKKYDLIIAELPLGLKRSVKNNDFDFPLPENWEMLYRLLDNLKDKGKLLVEIEPSLSTSDRGKKFLKSLENKGFFLNALFETPKNILAPVTSLQPHIALFSKEKSKKLFVASFEEADDEEIVFSNFMSQKSGGNLIEGDIVDFDKFKGFFNYKIGKKIDNLQTQYKEFEKKSIKDIAVILSTRGTFEEKEECNYLYIPQLGNLNVYSELEKLDKKHHNFYQLEINKKIARGKYLEQYFKSDLGQLSLKALLANTFIPKINKRELEDLSIPLPPLKTQEEIISSYSLLDNVFSVINNLEKELSLNPKNARKIIEKLTDTLDALNELSKADKVLHYIRQGENLKIEYKQTFSVDIKTGKKEKFIEDSTLKNIVGFLNKNGGVLLVGVTDNSEIYGIENDVYQSDDKYLLHFKNKVKTAIGEEFFDLINYEIVNIDDKKVLFIECKQSKKPVYMYDKDFYVRTNPATDKLEGPKLVDYINSHFK